MDSSTDHVEVGIVINTFGVKGEVKVMPLTNEPSDFSGFTEVFLGKSGEDAIEYVVRKARAHKKWVILRLEGVGNRDDAAKLRDLNIYVPKDVLGELPEDTYLESDLIGMEVFNTKAEFIGVISDILKTPANDVYQIRSEDGRELLIPAIKDVVKEVDIKANKMIIEPIQGLF